MSNLEAVDGGGRAVQFAPVRLGADRSRRRSRRDGVELLHAACRGDLRVERVAQDDRPRELRDVRVAALATRGSMVSQIPATNTGSGYVYWLSRDLNGDKHLQPNELIAARPWIRSASIRPTRSAAMRTASATTRCR